MTFVDCGEREPIDSLLRRFKRAVDAAGVLKEFRRRRHFVSANERRRLKVAAARQRRLRGQQRWAQSHGGREDRA